MRGGFIMCLHNPFARFMCIFFLLMFICVYISDYKTWMPTFKNPFQAKKIREKETNKIQ